MRVNPIPDGYHSLTPYLVVRGAAPLIDVPEQIYRAEELSWIPGPGSRRAVDRRPPEDA